MDGDVIVVYRSNRAMVLSKKECHTSTIMGRRGVFTMSQKELWES